MVALSESENKLEDRATGWINGLDLSGAELSGLRSELMGNMAEMLEKVAELGLPQMPHVSCSLLDFVNNPKFYLTQLKGDKFYTTIQSSDYLSNPNNPKPGVYSEEEILKMSKELLRSNPKKDFTIIVCEAKDIHYIGNFVVSSDGDIYGEFSSEKVPPTRSGVKEVMFFKKDHALDTFKYNFSDTSLRSAIYKTLDCLPHVGTGRERIWNKGYYECLFYKTKDGVLAPSFYDVRTCESFLFVPK